MFEIICYVIFGVSLVAVGYSIIMERRMPRGLIICGIVGTVFGGAAYTLIFGYWLEWPVVLLLAGVVNILVQINGWSFWQD